MHVSKEWKSTLIATERIARETEGRMSTTAIVIGVILFLISLFTHTPAGTREEESDAPVGNVGTWTMLVLGIVLILLGVLAKVNVI